MKFLSSVSVCVSFRVIYEGFKLYLCFREVLQSVCAERLVEEGQKL